MLAIGRSVFSSRLHSRWPLAAFSTAAAMAATPDGPAPGEDTAALAAGAAARAALAVRTAPARKPVRRVLVPMTPPLRSDRTTGASLSVAARRRKRLGQVGRPREHGPAGPERHRRTDRAMGAAGDPHHDRGGLVVAVGLDAQDGVVPVVAVGG